MDRLLCGDVGVGKTEVALRAAFKAIMGGKQVAILVIRIEQYDRYNLDVIGTEDKITWRSSNPRVCTVSSSGEVIGRRAGTATVTATVNNKTLRCVVTVTNIR